MNTNPLSAEAVRVRAVRLVCDDGWSTADAAKAVGRSLRSVQLWVRRSRRGTKPERLRTRTAPGAKPKLTPTQRAKLVRILTRGPRSAGFAAELWTGPRIAELIAREFRVAYHVAYLPTLLRALGFTPQRPKAKPSERDEAAIAAWVRTRWPGVKKKPADSAPPSSSSTKPAS
jgi:transposase